MQLSSLEDLNSLPSTKTWQYFLSIGMAVFSLDTSGITCTGANWEKIGPPNLSYFMLAYCLIWDKGPELYHVNFWLVLKSTGIRLANAALHMQEYLKEVWVKD